MRLKFGVEFIFAGFFLVNSLDAERRKEVQGVLYRLVSLKQDHSATLVSRRQIVTSVVEFDGGNDIR